MVPESHEAVAHYPDVTAKKRGGGMGKNDKAAIVAEVEHLSKMMSQKAVATKAMVSTATISQMIAGNWDLISDDMFRKVQGNLNIDLNWNVALTDNLKEAYHFCRSCKMQGLAILISDNAGKGKSNAYKYFARRNENVVHLECKASWTKKSFVRNLLLAMGVTPQGTCENMLDRFNDTIKRWSSPLLILDQADKLKDPQLDLFMEFYNDHEGHLGIILSGVEALRKRIDRGVQHQKVGYDELFSRVGRRHISLNPISKADVAAVCNANGVDNEEDITYIFDTFGGDFRRVRREIKKIHLSRTQQPEIIA
ncbi:AAA family ATPase [Leeuwenhoekiella aequorea]|uniref:AAA family ATPase n=1 Tax=Leeuwenhoekiella aequorea TaxID=283736 RepID=UPI00352D89E8|tara:strand:+ start:3749 stop:4675 length:927 start_codon:yes stop_codon:yes gene_type:complete